MTVYMMRYGPFEHEVFSKHASILNTLMCIETIKTSTDEKWKLHFHFYSSEVECFVNSSAGVAFKKCKQRKHS